MVDSETGLYNYGARYYDPSISVWMSVDPLTDQMASWNPYNYVFNNPINLIDPDGKWPRLPTNLINWLSHNIPNNSIGLKIATDYMSMSPIQKRPAKNYEALGMEQDDARLGCYAVCKSRYFKAFESVKSRSVINSLRDGSESKYYDKKQTFNHLYNVAQGFETSEGAENVVSGTYDLSMGVGHSMIFLGYQKDSKGNIIGLNVADQGSGWDIYGVGKLTFNVLYGVNHTDETN